MRARLHAQDGRFGFFREGTHKLCDPATTRQLLPETIEVLRRLEASVGTAPRSVVNEVALAENCAASERACHLELAVDADPSRLAAATQVEGLVGVSCGTRPRALSLWGSPVVADTLHGVRLARHARAFFQGNRHLLPQLVTRVTDAVPHGAVVDLYAGVGLFSAALAARGGTQVTAVEGDDISAEDLKRNVATFAGVVTATHQSVERFLGSRRPTSPFDCVVVDPPRTGLSKDAVYGVIALGAARVVYLSCDVATLARDVRMLVDRGYQLAQVEGFDLFPNTAHVETLAIVDRVN
jgi:23S rRNA (uracil1939-C5)-methyltransferase